MKFKQQWVRPYFVRSNMAAMSSVTWQILLQWRHVKTLYMLRTASSGFGAMSKAVFPFVIVLLCIRLSIPALCRLKSKSIHILVFNLDCIMEYASFGLYCKSTQHFCEKKKFCNPKSAKTWLQTWFICGVYGSNLLTFPRWLLNR